MPSWISVNELSGTIRSHPPPHAGCPRGDPGPLPVLTSFALIQRVSALAVEVAQVLSLDEVESPSGDLTEQIDDLLMRDRGSFVLGHETTAPMIRAESFRLAARPNLNAAIADHYQL